MSVASMIRKLAGVDSGESQVEPISDLPKIVIVGNPNVGKSLLFNKLTGRYVTVSNYPGTTVEVSRGRSRILHGRFEVIDTPGMYSLTPITDEERVALNILLTGEAKVVIHVIDAKNIQRMLGLTLQLIEANLPVILVMNMSDEARELGFHFDVAKLQALLGVPVVQTVATSGEGIHDLARRIVHYRPGAARAVDYGAVIEERLAGIMKLQDASGRLSPRTRGVLALQDDKRTDALLPGSRQVQGQVAAAVAAGTKGLEHSLHYYLSVALRREVNAIIGQAVKFPSHREERLRDKLDRLCMSPLTGVPILLLVLYFGFYQFVGVLGAGTFVNFLEETVFAHHINPWVTSLLAFIPWQILRDLFVGEYGIFTLGFRYAVAIILPVVGMFFLAFSVLEDSGYLPRLAMLIDRVFKKIGLNGRAVIPLVLGFGCDTMATMVTRTLETRREKIIASFLLALAIPCSAQLGVILAILSAHPWALVVWAVFVGLTFLLAGFLAARLMPGEQPSFYMELPPLRLPRLSNVMVKTYTRIVWYFKEVLPLFIVASVLIWLGNLTGAFGAGVNLLKPVVHWIGLPDEAAKAFLYGFFRRDYGAAGLYDLHGQNVLSGNQLCVAAITLTLFLPCIAQFLMLKKEQGLKMAVGMSVSIVLLAFGGGYVVNGLLNLLKVTL